MSHLHAVSNSGTKLISNELSTVVVVVVGSLSRFILDLSFLSACSTLAIRFPWPFVSKQSTLKKKIFFKFLFQKALNKNIFNNKKKYQNIFHLLVSILVSICVRAFFYRSIKSFIRNFCFIFVLFVFEVFCQIKKKNCFFVNV